jgi:putative transposase
MPTLRINKSVPDAIYYSTLTIIEWIDIFTKPEYFECLIDSLNYCQNNKGLQLHGYVFMTNHIHLIYSVLPDHKPEDFLRDFKKWTTRKIDSLLDQESRHYIRNLLSKSFHKKEINAFQLWQTQNYSEMIETEDFFLQKLKYMHLNPVRKGYVLEARDWKYSSARNWECQDDSVIEVKKIEL